MFNDEIWRLGTLQSPGDVQLQRLWDARHQMHGHMAKGSHGLCKAKPEPAMPYSFTPCGQVTPETALQPFQEWPARKTGGLQPFSTLLDTPTPYAYRDE